MVHYEDYGIIVKQACNCQKQKLIVEIIWILWLILQVFFFS